MIDSRKVQDGSLKRENLPRRPAAVARRALDHGPPGGGRRITWGLSQFSLAKMGLSPSQTGKLFFGRPLSPLGRAPGAGEGGPRPAPPRPEIASADTRPPCDILSTCRGSLSAAPGLAVFSPVKRGGAVPVAAAVLPALRHAMCSRPVGGSFHSRAQGPTGFGSRAIAWELGKFRRSNNRGADRPRRMPNRWTNERNNAVGLRQAGKRRPAARRSRNRTTARWRPAA